MADINQDLLLAVLALLTDSVPRDALRTALAIWSQDSERSLGLLLKEQGTLDEGRLQALECLVSSHLRSHNGDIQSSLDAWNAQALTHDMLTELDVVAPGNTVGATLVQSLTLTAPGKQEGTSRAREGLELTDHAQAPRFELI